MILVPHIEDAAAYHLLPFVSTISLPPFPQLHPKRSLQSLEDSLSIGDLIYEYLARETNETSGPCFPDWPVDSPLVNLTYSGFATPPIIIFAPASLYFLGLTQRHLPGTDLLFPPHLPPPRFLRSHPPHYAADNHLLNQDAIEAHPRSTAPNENGAAVCAWTPSVISTNVNDTSTTLENK